MVLQGCVNCGQALTATGQVCPHCGSEQPVAGDVRRKAHLKLAGVIILVVFALGVNAFFVMKVTAPRADFNMVEAVIRPVESGHPIVTGIVQNRGNALYSDTRFEIQLLDQEGSTVGTTVVIAHAIGGGERWTFEAPLPPGDQARVTGEVPLECRVQYAGPQRTRAGLQVRFACTDERTASSG